MDKTDVMYGIAAIVIILVMALVVKPMVTGQPVNTGFPVTVTTAAVPVTTSAATLVPTTVVTTTPPTPVPTWDNKVQSIGFVGSRPDDATLTPAPLDATRFDTRLLNTSMTSFAKINGKTSGTTQVVRIPFPYWEIVYTVDPMAESQTSSYQVTPTMGSGVAYSGLSGSYSGVKPEFIIQVMDADDPNRIVRIVTPPGGIDAALWKTAGSTDPRPWTEKFFEGQRSYYFIITAQMLSSYSIDIRVPVRYIGTV